MRYFENFPKIAITDQNNNTMLYTNLLTRVNLIPGLINNPSLFYQYNLQEGDRPDIIATKYYNNPYRYWIFLYGNNIMDPIWDLPMDSNTFELYLNDKYGTLATSNNQSVLAYTQSTVYQYQKVVQTIDGDTGTVTTNYYNIDEATYNSLPSNHITTQNFSDGNSVTLNITKQIQSIYDYEYQVNENKRSVNIVDKKYSSQMEQALATLLSN